MPHVLNRLLALLCLAFVSSCVAPTTDADDTARAEVAAAMEQYQVAARAVDVDAWAGRFTLDGMLLEPGIPPIRTRAAIREFLASFPGVTVVTATATPEVIEVHDDRAYLWGTFFEVLDFPGQPRSEQHGMFVASWVRQPDGAWLIERMMRVPVATSESTADPAKPR